MPRRPDDALACAAQASADTASGCHAFTQYRELAMTDTTAASGLIVLQGNRMEDLRDLTLKWLGRRPLHRP